MKTLVKTVAAVALIAVSTFVMAADKTASISEKAIVNHFTADLTLEHYVAVITEGESRGVNQLFTGDFNQKTQSTEAKAIGRDQLVEFLKSQKGEKLNCRVNTQIIDESADYMIAKVTMKFEHFTKTDLITLVREGSCWKVSTSINSYK
ncbi:nuclear transport factor 2 family protein [Sphingobacterium sp.]|uniref:nuclear transport factor 2 family protein n=1 Tax=Sphingobacterium sp. TaxID=341027 RepID=UPI00289EF224|nr:nuclear transport factor 2 family protein [Sphingobacterium sp.]